MSFDALPHDAWPDAAAILPRPWPASLAAHDLRWHAAEHHVYKRPLPAHRALAARWGWSATRTLDLVRDEAAWRDSARPWGWRARTAHEPRNERADSAQGERDNADNGADSAHEPRNERADSAQEMRSRARSSSPEHPPPAPAPEPEERACAHEPPPAGGSHTDPPPPAPVDTPAPTATTTAIPAPIPTTTPATPAPAPTATTPTLPAWVPAAAACGGHPRLDVAAMVARCIEAVRQRPPNPATCGTDARPLLALWRARGRPPPAEFLAEFAAVAEWARLSPEPLAARDIRAEGWAEGTDRHKSVATLARQDRYQSRLDVATAWQAAGQVTVKAAPVAPPATPRQQRARDDRDRLNNWLRSKTNADTPGSHHGDALLVDSAGIVTGT